MARFFRHGELPLVLLALLDERELNAYELMSSLGDLLGSAYSPSPGSIYPAVDALEAEGLISARSDGSRTTYSATASGRAALERRRDALAAFELRTGTRVSQRATVDGALARFTTEVRNVATSLDASEVEELLDEAITNIRRYVQERSARRVKEA